MVAPDAFKGSCSAAEVAAAIVAGLHDVWGDRVVYESLPLADGGEGTVAVFLDAGAVARRATVRGPLGAPVVATYARLGETAIVEMAAASGLGLGGGRSAPVEATTFGTGELIRAALDAGARRIIVALGGSATTDGGAGALAALGLRFLDGAGHVLEPEPRALVGLAAVDAGSLDPRLARIDLELACDVENPLLGPTGAAAVYGPQKGASPADVAVLERVLDGFADLATTETGRDLRAIPGAGAAGGLGWGLATFAGARFGSGFALVAALRGFPAALQGAALCCTGEGRIDAQTLAGKVVGGVAMLAAAAGVPVVAYAGSVDPVVEPSLGARGVACVPIVAGPLDLAGAMRDAPALIRAAAARSARLRPAPA